MAKVIGIHGLQLKKRVSPADWERYLLGPGRPVEIPGMQASIARVARGPQAGSYALIVELESVETRDRYFPVPDEGPAGVPEEVRQALVDLVKQLEQLATRTWFGDWVLP